MSDDPVPAAIAALSDQVWRLADQVTTLSVQVSGLDPKLTAIASQQAQTRGAIMERLERLQNRFDELRAEAAVRRPVSP